MKLSFCSFLLALILPVSASLAASFLKSEPRWSYITGKRIGCLTQIEAGNIRDAYTKLFYKKSFSTAYAKGILTDDYKLYSESTNEIASGLNKYPHVEDCTFCSPAEVAAYSANNNPAYHPIYKDLIVSCDSFAFRWSFNSKPISTGGIDIVHVKKGTYKVQLGYQEFNSQGLCFDIPACKAGVLAMNGCSPEAKLL